MRDERDGEEKQTEGGEGRAAQAGPTDRPEGTVRLGSIECSVTREENANARVRQTARRHVRANKRESEAGRKGRLKPAGPADPHREMHERAREKERQVQKGRKREGEG